MTESEARELWHSWTEEQKLDFIVQHDYNPRFAKYVWVMLPYSVQQEVRQNPQYESIPHVVGVCASCSYAYDLTKGIGCPHCDSEDIAWSYYATTDDEQSEVIERLRRKMAPELTEGEKLDVAELERMYKLEG